MDPKIKLYRDGSFAEKAIAFAGVAGVVVTLVSIGIAVLVVWPQPPRGDAQAVLFLMAGVWGVGGPMWFFSEYFFFYRKEGTEGSWEQFKHGQQVSAAIWAGLSVSLAALGTSDLAKPSANNWSCEWQSAGTPASGVEVSLKNCKKAAS